MSDDERGTRDLRLSANIFRRANAAYTRRALAFSKAALRLAMMQASSRTLPQPIELSVEPQAHPERSMEYETHAMRRTRAIRSMLSTRIALPDARRRNARSINASLSGALFFCRCWCMRDEVHFDSRMHRRLSHLIHQEGNMAKKAKKAKKATKAKSAVKKTAKKTKKVAKKKK